MQKRNTIVPVSLALGVVVRVPECWTVFHFGGVRYEREYGKIHAVAKVAMEYRRKVCDYKSAGEGAVTPTPT